MEGALPDWSSDFGACHVAVVGAAGGLGREVSRRLARFGAALSVFDHPQSAGKLDSVLAELPGAKSIRAFSVDIADGSDVNKAFAAAMDKSGPLTHLVNAAAIYRNERMESFLPATFELVHNTNLLGAAHLAHAFLGHSRRDVPRAIVNVSSDSATDTAEGDCAYACSKAALNVLTRHLSLEFASENVRVNAIAPGWMLTEMTRFAWEDPEFREQAERDVALGYLAAPAIVAEAAVMLCTSAAEYITGQVITVNGGRTYD